jgi:hypothetical protein
MMYQGHLVNFSQPTDAQFRGLVTAVGQTNYQVATNSRNLVKIGKDMTKIGQDNTYFGKAITQLDTAVRQLISTGTGQGMTQQQVEQIVENYHGDDIALLYSNHADQEGRLTDAFNDRQMIDAKANATQAEHGDFNNKLQTLGDKMLEHVNSPHNQGGGNGGIMSYLPLLAVGGLAAYLLKGKLKI